MTVQGWLLIIAFFGVLLALTKPVGQWLFALYEGRHTPLHRVIGPVENGFYKLAGINPNEEQSWRRYAVHMLVFNAALALFTYALLRMQAFLPFNPLGLAAVPEHLDRFLRSDGSDGERLLDAFERGDVDRGGERLRHAGRDEEQRIDDRDRQ